MKFLCDNCKAKYQIADDKVAGKTVRMKCRKCGHQIEVRAAVTETSVSSALNELESPSQISKNSLATSLSAQKPRAQAASHPGSGHGGALAGAFQRTVQEGAAPSPSQPSNLELSVSDEWYVAINGVPVGPVRVSELRRKAATGAITEESLCWQEGLEEWRPIRAVPELAAIVREAAQTNRVSIVGPPPSEPRMPAVQAPRAPQKPATPAPLAARTPDPPREATRPLGPPPGGGMVGGMGGRSNVVPFHARTATAEKLDDVPLAPFGSAATALAPAVAPGTTPSPEVAPPAPVPTATPFAPPAAQLSPVAVADPFAVPPPAIGGSAPPAAAAAVPFVSAPAPAVAPPTIQKRGVPVWFFAVFAVALFGLVAFLALHQPPPQQIIVQVPTPTASQSAAPIPTDIPPPVASVEPTPSATASGKPATAAPKSTAVAAATPTAAEKKTADLSGLLPGVGGPSAGPGGPGSGSGGGLDSASVQRVVRERQAGVKRSCWERGGGDQKSSANVTVTANVAANGTVSSASSSGDDPVIGKCIENQVRTWTFPAPGSPTTVAIPFHFVRQ
ncbi:Signal recognition particle receptor protein FtsY [Labilithrix luteola]|uniref:Signal recognition particle receptor protein FtsY n=1 Tax=Labilithrix luteola TaxID=1391654 RepID=A0A0K1QCE3_9BACT|nr:GYF domain-containing protein [Labilithrix luteola]AKV03451.1 Signal recognition particle receptor protein FtsY [Labilithrix luteola]